MALYNKHHLQEIDLIFVRIGDFLQMQTSSNNDVWDVLALYKFRALYHLNL